MHASKDETCKKRRGLVLSGGGALGAYQAGALTVFRRYGITFEVLAAASIGVLHALAWNRDMVENLEQLWLDNVDRLLPFDINRLRKLENPFQFKHARDRLFDRYRDNHSDPGGPGTTPIIVSLTDASTGKNELFRSDDPSISREERELIYKASSVIPPLGDKPIKIRGRRYYDGGFSNNLPVEAFNGMDLDEIWAISLLPGGGHPVWRREAYTWIGKKMRKTGNPWLAGTAGLLEQTIEQGDYSFLEEDVIMLTLEKNGGTRAKRLVKAFTFSRHNIKKLFAIGRVDAESKCRLHC